MKKKSLKAASALEKLVEEKFMKVDSVKAGSAKERSWLPVAVLASVFAGSVMMAIPAWAATSVTTDTTYTKDTVVLDADKTINVKDATLTLSNDAGSKAWDLNFSVLQASGATGSTLKFTGGGFQIWQEDGAESLNVKKIIFDNNDVDFDAASIGSGVQEIELNGIGQKKIYNFTDYTLNANVTGTQTFSIESSSGTSITLGSGKTIATGLDIFKDLDATISAVKNGSLVANANQLTGTEDIKVAGVLTLTGGTLTRNVTAGTVRSVNYETSNVESTTTGKGEVYVTGALTIADGVSVTADIYGVKKSDSTAIEGTSVSVTGGTISEPTNVDHWIIAARSLGSGNITNNVLTLKNVVVDAHNTSNEEDWVAGAFTTSGTTFTANKVIAENATLKGSDVAGGFTGSDGSSDSVGSYNEVSLTNCIFSEGVIFGTGAGKALSNTVTIKGGTYTTEKISGGEGLNLVDSNKVVIDGGKFATADDDEGLSVCGGLVDERGSGNVTSNSVEFKSGTMNAPSSTDTRVENVLYGGQATLSGDVTGNSVTVSGGTFTRTGVIGGRSEGTGDVTGNSVNITGGTFTGNRYNGIGGGTILYTFDSTVTSAVVLGSANNNSVKITDGTFNGMYSSTEYMCVIGGLVEIDNFNDEDETEIAVLEAKYTSGGASNNTVEITTTKSAKFYEIHGGSTFQGSASGNTVTLDGSGIVVENDILGGVAIHEVDDKVDIRVDANNNILNLTNITVNDSVYGGEGNGTGSTASYNEVHISGGQYTNSSSVDSHSSIGGGSARKEAIGNIVEIKNAIISSETITGGLIYALDGIVKDNKVILDGVTFNFGGTNTLGGTGSIVIGGACGIDGTFTGTRSGNTLEVGSNGFTINSGKAVTIGNFDSMTFEDGATVTNNGTLTFGSNGDDEATEDVVWNAKIGGTGKVVVAGEITVSNTVSNSGGIEITTKTSSDEDEHKLRVTDAAYIGTAVTNNGALNLYGGTLSQVVTNTNGTVKIKGDVATTGDKIVGGTLQVKGGGHLLLNNSEADSLVVDVFQAFDEIETEEEEDEDWNATDNKISFDAGFTSVVDQVSAETYKGTITLGAVGLTEEFEGTVGDTTTYQLFTGSSDYSNFTINGSAEAVMGTYKYVFTDNGTNDGKLKVTKEYGYSLHDIINNTDEGQVAGKVTSYSLNDNKTETEGLGTLTRVSGASSRELTINGNGYTLTAPTGITVNSEDTLTLKDIAYKANDGVAVKGDGTTKFAGEVIVDGSVVNAMVVLEGADLSIKPADIGNTVTNGGTVSLGGGTLVQTISGGSVVIEDDDVTAAADKFDGVEITHENILTLTGGVLNSNVSGSGETIIDGDVTVAKGVTLKGLQAAGTNDTIVGKGVYVNSGKTLTVKGTLDGYVDNGGTLNFEDGSSLVGYVETVKGNAAESIINLTGNVSITTKAGLCDNKHITLCGKQINITDAVVTDTKSADFIKYKQATITDSTVNSKIAGLALRNSNFSSTGNSITITNSTINGTLYGGLTSQAGTTESTVTANNNTVTISKSTVQDVYGAKADSASEITGNTVALSDTKVSGDIYGGYTGSENANKAYSNTVTLDKVTLTGGTTHNVFASTNNTQKQGGLVNVLSQGLVNNGTTILGGGKVKIDGNITGTGDLTIKSATGENNAEITQNSLTNENVLTTAMDKVHVTTFTNNGTLNASGTLAYAVAGEGTNKVAEGAELTLAEGASLANLTVAGTLVTDGVTDGVNKLILEKTAVLDLENEAYETTTFDTLTAADGAVVNFDANFAAAGDQISATTASGKLTLGSIGMKDDYDGEVGTEKTYTLLTGNASAIELQGTAETVLGQYKYVFEKGATAGTLKVKKDNGYTLHQVINNETAYGQEAGTVTNYSLNKDATETEGLGTLTRVTDAESRELTINGNEHSLTAPTGITVNSGDTLTLKDITYSVTTGDAVSGAGTTKFAGTVNANSKVSTAMEVLSGATLNVTAANIGNTVANAGTINLAGGELNNIVTGEGTLNVNADAAFNTKVENEINVAEDVTLTAAAGNLGGDVANAGTVMLGAGTLNKVITGGEVTMTGSVTTAAGNLDSITKLTNEAVLTLTAGTLNSIVNGADGSVNIAGDVTLAANVNQAITIASGKLVTSDAALLGDAVYIASAAAELDLNGGTLGQEVSGSGVVKTNGTLDIDANVSVAEIDVVTGTVKANASKLDAIVNNAGTLNISGGSFAKEVKGTGTLNVKGSVKANSNVTAGIVNVESGKSFTVSGDLSVGTITLQDAYLTVEEGNALSIGTSMTMNGSSTVVTVDRGSVLDDDLDVITGLGTKIVGTAGELVLRMNGANYYADDLADAKENLFGDGSVEKAKLTFKNGNLQMKEGQQVTTGGSISEVTEDSAIITGAVTSVADENGKSIAEVEDQLDKTVTVITNEPVSKITFDGKGKLGGQDLQVDTVDGVLDITVDGSSTLNLGGKGGIVKDNDGNAVATSVTVNSGSNFSLGNEEVTETVDAGNINVLTVGGNVNIYKVILNITNLVINGGMLWIDPTYVSTDELKFTGGALGVDTDGSVTNVGMDYDTLNAALQRAGITSNADKTVSGNYGVLALNSSLNLGSNYLAVDAKENVKTSGGTGLQLGENSVLVVNGGSKITVADAGNVSVADSSKLIVTDEEFTIGDEYIVLSADAGEFTDDLWLKKNIYASKSAYTFDVVGGSDYVLTVKWNTVEGIYGDTAIAAPKMYDTILQGDESTDAHKFLVGVNDVYGQTGDTSLKAVGAAMLNAATNMGEAAGVQHGAVSMANQISDTLSSTMSLVARPQADGKYDKQIWASYVNNKETVDGLSLAKLDAVYDAKFSGVTVGADLWSSENAVGGLAITYSKGDINGSTGGVSTNNDAKYYGFSLYNRSNVAQDSALLYDLGYMNTKNEITQYNHKTITADAKVDVLTAGVRYEKAIRSGKSTLAPFVGLRYLHLNNKEYTNSLNMHYAADNQNIFQPSLGLSWSGEFQAPNSVWTWRPVVEAGYVWNLGSVDCEQVVSFDGAPNTLAYDVVDRGSYFGRLGMDFIRKNFTFGLGYKYQKGSSVKNSKWNVNLSWSF